ncbi:Hypothetical predicted protein, partial [Paramuricea clavata]
LWQWEPEDSVILDTKAIGVDTIPDFQGGDKDKVTPETFVRAVNMHQTMRKLSDTQAARMALCRLQKGVAGEWTTNLAHDGSPALHNWPLLRQKFNKRFRPGPTYSAKAEALRSIDQGDMSPNDFWDRTGTIFNQTCDTLIDLQDSQGRIQYQDCREYLRTLFFVIGLQKEICDVVIHAGATTPDELLEAANHAWITKQKSKKLEVATAGVAAIQIDDTGQDDDINVNSVQFRGRGQRGGRNQRNFRGGRSGFGSRGGNNSAPPPQPNSSSFSSSSSFPAYTCSFCTRKGHQEHECRTKQSMMREAATRAQQRGGRGQRRGYQGYRGGQQMFQQGYGFQGQMQYQQQQHQATSTNAIETQPTGGPSIIEALEPTFTHSPWK